MKKTILSAFVLLLALALPAFADSFDSIILTPPAGTNTGIGATASVAVSLNNLRTAKQGLFILTDTALAGGTLDGKLQVTYDGTNWADFPSGAFTQLTATGSTALRLAGPFGYKLRYHLTNGATVSASLPSVKAFVHY